MTPENKLSLNNISKSYSTNGIKTAVLKNISFDFLQGTSYAITGASGSGKSTLLHIIGGIDNPTNGYLSYNNRKLTCFKPNELEEFRRNTIGFMFQNHYLISELSILDNVALPHRILGHDTYTSTTSAAEMLAHVGLTGMEQRLPHELSGGQQQRAALARALVNHPKFLLADEPTGNLDANTAAMITNLLIIAQREWMLGVIVCTHDTNVADQLNFKLQIELGSLK